MSERNPDSGDRRKSAKLYWSVTDGHSLHGQGETPAEALKDYGDQLSGELAVMRARMANVLTALDAIQGREWPGGSRG